MLSSPPCFPAFCWSALPTSHYIFYVYLVLFTLAVGTDITWTSLVDVNLDLWSCTDNWNRNYTYQPSVEAHGLVTRISSSIIDQTRLSSNTPCTPASCISNSAILCNNYISLLSDLRTCIHLKNKWYHKGSHSSSVTGSNILMKLQDWKKAMGSKSSCAVHWNITAIPIPFNRVFSSRD